LPTSTADLWDTIAGEAGRESELWTAALRPREGQEREPVFSRLGEERYALGIETIYEGYLLHYGSSRLFSPEDGDAALLLGDYLYAHGLVRVAEHQDVEAIADLAALISRCAQLRADGGPGDGEAWAATAALIGHGPLSTDRDPAALAGSARDTAGGEAVERALALHAGRVG
jgi:hypothetical protein